MDALKERSLIRGDKVEIRELSGRKIWVPRVKILNIGRMGLWETKRRRWSRRAGDNIVSRLFTMIPKSAKIFF